MTTNATPEQIRELEAKIAEVVGFTEFNLVDARDWEMLVDELAKYGVYGSEYFGQDTMCLTNFGVRICNIATDIGEGMELTRQAARYYALTEALPTIEQLIKEKG